MPPRLFVAEPLASGTVIALPAPATRHVQVLRMQPGGIVTLFNGGDDAEWPAEIVAIGRSAVEVRLGAAQAVDRELACAVTIALGVPANDRMDALVEKAGELGAAAIQPLVCERSVLRLSGERAEAKRRHWSGVAVAASEQCGRARVTEILPMRSLSSWLGERSLSSDERCAVLSFDASAVALAAAWRDVSSASSGDSGQRPKLVVLSGPEGGLSGDEESAAVQRGFVRIGLGARVLRADTAPLAVLAWLGLRDGA